MTIAAQKDSLDYTAIARQLDKSKPLNEIILQAANLLIGRPYVGGTLDAGADERLVVNFDKFDCVTFQETCSALALDAKSGRQCYSTFKSKLESLRYQDGLNTGYPSRLHYSSIWLIDNSKRKNISILSQNIGGEVLQNNVNFMSTHSDLYSHLRGNTKNISCIRQTENFINQNRCYYIPKDKVKGIEGMIPSGSLIFITTSKAGLDFAHVGIAEYSNGALRFIHASSTAHKVTKTVTSLSDYLAGVSTFTGIAVATLLY